MADEGVALDAEVGGEVAGEGLPPLLALLFGRRAFLAEQSPDGTKSTNGPGSAVASRQALTTISLAVVGIVRYTPNR